MTGVKSDPFGLLGQVLDGQFRIDELVGEGGSSVVYRGEHVGFEAKVAIKCLKLQSQLGSALVETFLRRFRDEGRMAYRLSQGHFHIVRCLAIGTTIAPKSSSLVPYTVLEWLDGHSLARQFEERRRAAGQGRPLADLLKMLDPAADALGYAHGQGVTHRDLNPGSIFLVQGRDGLQAKVLDFGLAKMAGEHPMASGGDAAAATAFRVFSPAYAAPEQFDEQLGAIGPWTDVYSLAMLLLEGMRDQPPFLGLSLEDLRQKILDPKARPTPRNLGVVVSDEVQTVFGRALALKPSDRVQDASAFWSALKLACDARLPVQFSRPLPDATQRMDALPFSDRLPLYDDAPLRDDAPTVRDEREMQVQSSGPAVQRPAVQQPAAQSPRTEKAILDEDTTIDERLEGTLPA
ncbi:MAG TPA: serine/threonine-protein kinase, partial [Polyangiaceae bacterium]|nr:serine/threonine-protein kinase [Polyangiaceae bacterium]